MELTSELVHVRVPGRDSLVARLLDRDGKTLLLRAPRSEAGVFLPEIASPLDVGLVTKEGIVWHAGVVSGLEPGPSVAVHVKLLGRTVGRERRGDPRVQDSLDVEILVPGTDPVAGSIVDVSTGGLRVEAPIPLEVGDAVQVAVQIPDGEPIQLTARVVHVAARSSSGFRFELATAGARERLVRRAFQRLVA